MAETTATARNPRDSTVTFQRIRFERSATSGGAYAEISNVAINPYDETTEYTDIGGTTTDWYRYRYANTAGTNFSDYSGVLQAGDYATRQRIKRSIPDADITDPMWDDWRDQAILELNAEAIGRWADIQVVSPTSTTTYDYDLNGDIRRVVGVQMYSGSNYVRNLGLASWRQRGRKITITRPSTSYKYYVSGIAEIRDSADLDDELWVAVEKYMRWKYLETRVNQRMNYELFLSSDKKTDVGGDEISDTAEKAKLEWLRYINLLRLNTGVST